MKKREKYEQQKETRRKNEHRILSSVALGARTFTELQRISGLTPAGLNTVLKRLVKDEKIFKRGTRKKTRYRAGHGTTAKEILYLGYTIENFRDNSGKYYIDYSDNHQSEATGYGQPFEIRSHLFLDRQIGRKFNPILKKDIFEMENILFEKLKSNIKNKKVPKLVTLGKEEANEIKVVIAFEIKYARLLEIIANYNEKDHKKLLQLRFKELKK